MKIRESNIDENYMIRIFKPDYDSITMFVSEMGDLLQLDVVTLVESFDILENNSFLLFKSHNFIGCIGSSYIKCNGYSQPTDDAVLIIKKENIIGFHIDNIKAAKGSGGMHIYVKYAEGKSKCLFTFGVHNGYNSDEKLEDFKNTYLLEIMRFWELDVPISQWNGYDC